MDTESLLLSLLVVKPPRLRGVTAECRGEAHGRRTHEDLPPNHHIRHRRAAAMAQPHRGSGQTWRPCPLGEWRYPVRLATLQRQMDDAELRKALERVSRIVW